MNPILIGSATAIIALVTAVPAAAQRAQAFATVGVITNFGSSVYPTVNGGVVVDVIDSWLAIGGQGDVFFGGGYASGRGGVLGQGRIVPRGAVQPFVLGGYTWGEESGPFIGGGVDLWPGVRRLGVRADVQARRRQEYYTNRNELTFHVGVSWRIGR